MTPTEVLQSFHELPLDEKMTVARQIQAELADLLFDELDKDLPDLPISEEEVMQEVLAVRYNRDPNAAAGH